MSTPTNRPIAFTDAAETWNRRNADEDFLFGTEPNAWLREHASRVPTGGHILSVADGEGRKSVRLAQQSFQVDAFDIAHRAVEKAQAFSQRQGVSVNFALADVDRFAWPEAAYDGVAAIFVQFAAPDTHARLFERIARSLKPGGVLVLQGYTPKQLDYRTGGPPILSHLYTRELLASAFSDLQIIELREYEAEVREGQGHSGQSALLGLVARR